MQNLKQHYPSLCQQQQEQQSSIVPKITTTITTTNYQHNIIKLIPVPMSNDKCNKFTGRISQLRSKENIKYTVTTRTIIPPKQQSLKPTLITVKNSLSNYNRFFKREEKLVSQEIKKINSNYEEKQRISSTRWRKQDNNHISKNQRRFTAMQKSKQINKHPHDNKNQTIKTTLIPPQNPERFHKKSQKKLFQNSKLPKLKQQKQKHINSIQKCRQIYQNHKSSNKYERPNKDYKNNKIKYKKTNQINEQVKINIISAKDNQICGGERSFDILRQKIELIDGDILTQSQRQRFRQKTINLIDCREYDQFPQRTISETINPCYFGTEQQ